jgi:hypothetical protein
MDMNEKNSTNTSEKDKQTVLFQKLGTSWYIFSEIENELYYSQMPEGMDPRETSLELYEIIEDHFKKLKDTNSNHAISMG